MSAALLTRLSDAQAEAVRATRSAVVEVSRGPGRRGAGAHLGGGRVVTCAHVVGDARDVQLRTTSGAEGPATVVATARADDLALVVVPEALGRDLPSLVLADPPPPGAPVFAVGHPGGSVGAASAGVVVGVDAGGRLVTDAHLRPGHSGGPLVDARGRLVGVCATLSAPDLGGAVASGDVLAFLAAADAPRLGALVQPVRLGTGVGLVVVDVAEGSVAAEAGLLIGDVVEAGGDPHAGPSDLGAVLGRRRVIPLRRGDARLALTLRPEAA